MHEASHATNTVWNIHFLCSNFVAVGFDDLASVLLQQRFYPPWGAAGLVDQWEDLLTPVCHLEQEWYCFGVQSVQRIDVGQSRDISMIDRIRHSIASLRTWGKQKYWRHWSGWCGQCLERRWIRKSGTHNSVDSLIVASFHKNLSCISIHQININVIILISHTNFLLDASYDLSTARLKGVFTLFHGYFIFLRVMYASPSLAWSATHFEGGFFFSSPDRSD